MKTLNLLFLLCLIVLNVSAQNVETKIKAVTVYKNGALVERTGKLNLQKGNTTLYLNNLSEELDPNTLRIGIENKGVKILSVKHEIVVVDNENAQKKNIAGDKRIAVVKDSSVGAGGIATLFLVASLTIAGLNNILDYNFIMGIVICEMVAKTSLLTTALTSKPLTPGIGSYFILSTTPLNYILSLIIVAVITFLLGGIVGLIGLLGAIFSGFLISGIAKRNFGVANGDVLGMSNEVGRLMALLFMSIALYFL